MESERTLPRDRGIDASLSTIKNKDATRTYDPATDSLQAISDAVAAISGGGTPYRSEPSLSGTVEENELMQFTIALFNLTSGAIALANIDITGITSVLSRSRAGGAFSAAGITQPVFGKSNGAVSCGYQFLIAEWQTGDIYRLVLSGIKVTVGATTYFVSDTTWSNAVTEEVELETKVDDIKAKTDHIPVPDVVAEGTTVMDGTEKILYEKTDNVIGQVEGYVDLTPMQAGDTIKLRQYMKIKALGAYALYNEDVYSDIQTVPLIHITTKLAKEAIKVTAEQTAIGAYRSIDAQFFRGVTS